MTQAWPAWQDAFNQCISENWAHFQRLFVFAAKYMPQDLPDMFEEIGRIQYSVQDDQDRVVLGVGQGAQLFNLAGAMSDEPPD